RRLAARLGAEDLRDATARVAADAEGAVEGQRSAGHHVGGRRRLLTEAEDGAFSDVLVDLEGELVDARDARGVVSLVVSDLTRGFGLHGFSPVLVWRSSGALVGVPGGGGRCGGEVLGGGRGARCSVRAAQCALPGSGPPGRRARSSRRQRTASLTCTLSIRSAPSRSAIVRATRRIRT